jgi:5-bromo-4-chloroindolyl phosphate hydrolysis protein
MRIPFPALRCELEYLGELVMSLIGRMEMEIKKRAGAPFLYIAVAVLSGSVMESVGIGEYRFCLLKMIGIVFWSLAAVSVNLGIRGLGEGGDAVSPDISSVSYTVFGAMMMGAGVFYLGWIVGSASLRLSLWMSLMAGIGVLLYYGSDPIGGKSPENANVGSKLFFDNLAEARDILENIRFHSKEVHDLRLHREIEHAISKAEYILDTIGRNPENLDLAKKFLAVYIDGLAGVTKRCRDTVRADTDRDAKERLYGRLREMEERLDRELERLHADGCYDLYVQLDALRERSEE